MATHQNYRFDDQIPAREVRLIDESGNQVGVIRIDEAKGMARERELNLVEVAPEARPPVCKLMDYGKFLYEQKKRDRRAKQKQHQIVIKEIRIRPKTDTHDMETKVRRARDFLERGDKVQVNMLFRGREMIHLEVGKEIMAKIAEALSDIAKLERIPIQEGKRMVMLLARK